MPTQELELAPVQADEKPMKQLAPFDEFRAQAEKLKVTAETLTVTDINDKAGMKLARATRLELREVRIAIDKRRKELGEHHLRETQRINTDAKELRDLIEPLEARLQLQEDFIEVETKRIADEKRAARASELAPFLSAPVAIDLGMMADDAYAALLSDSKDAHATKLAREQKEREEAAAKLKVEAEERARVIAENIRLKEENAKKEAEAMAERVKAESDRKAAEVKARKEREAIEDKAREEAIAAQKAREEERAKFEIEAKKQREESAEREDKIRAEAEASAKIIADKIKAATEAREALERKAAAAEALRVQEENKRKAAEKAAAAAPEKEKLLAFAKTIRDLHIPILKTESGISAQLEIAAQVEKLAAYVTKKASEL